MAEPENGTSSGRGPDFTPRSTMGQAHQQHDTCTSLLVMLASLVPCAVVVVLRLRSVDGLEQRNPGVPVSQEVQNLLIRQRVTPSVNNASQVNVGTKVTQR